MLEGNNDNSEAEIISLADALRTPLLQLHLNSQGVQDPSVLQVITENALRDIEAFMTTYSRAKIAQLQIGPVTLGAIMHDASERVKPYAKLVGLDIYVDDHTRHQPVLGNAGTLGLGLELVTKTMCDFTSDSPKQSITMRADTRHGYPRLGVYREDIELSAEDVALARRLIGGAQVNAGSFRQLAALRMVIASKLLEPLGLTLRSAKSAGRHGLALQLLPSSQIGMFEV
jgi:hypothetical protein